MYISLFSLNLYIIYIIYWCNDMFTGPEEDLPRSIDFFNFVCHAPSEYYRAKNSPYPICNKNRPDLGYISTAIGGEIARVPSSNDLYSLELRKDLEQVQRSKPMRPRNRRRKRRVHHLLNKDK